jgi:Chemotaxis phosphatase CheX
MNLSQALEVAVAETCEEMLFQVFVPTEGVEPLEDGFRAGIRITSPARFALELAVPKPTAQSLASLILGEEEPSEAAMSDLVAEICNTLVGSLARNLAEDIPLVFSPPTIGRGAPPPELGPPSWFGGDDARFCVYVGDVAA